MILIPTLVHPRHPLNVVGTWKKKFGEQPMDGNVNFAVQDTAPVRCGIQRQGYCGINLTLEEAKLIFQTSN
ncbi:hypothetical protein RvY_08365 [Ramazzottius varieornatus]|uniref:Uncharacterized protein n=1 Tax=Ramazzottius varieornatus TaxID=947166 RepID=A0A1D1VA73_RAMVA|nr:hypothetical protein RvY_08365 [Ramazzottius varieornatus]